MRRFVVDANVFLRFLLHDIPEQYNKAKRLFIRANSGEVELIVPQIIIFELVYALEKYYQFSQQDIVDKLEDLVATNYFQIQDRVLLIKSLKFYKHHKIDITDCFLYCWASEQGIDLFTFDKDLAELAKLKN